MKKKLLYEVPEAEQFFVKYEENIMSVVESKSIQSLEYDDEELSF